METAYVLVYDKENEGLPRFVGPFMSSFKGNIDLSQVLKDKQSKNIPPRKQEILSSLNTSGFDEKLQHKFNVVFSSKFETEMEKENNSAVFFMNCSLTTYFMLMGLLVQPLVQSILKCHLNIFLSVIIVA